MQSTHQPVIVVNKEPAEVVSMVVEVLKQEHGCVVRVVSNSCCVPDIMMPLGGSTTASLRFYIADQGRGMKPEMIQMQSQVIVLLITEGRQPDWWRVFASKMSSMKVLLVPVSGVSQAARMMIELHAGWPRDEKMAAGEKADEAQGLEACVQAVMTLSDGMTGGSAMRTSRDVAEQVIGEAGSLRNLAKNAISSNRTIEQLIIQKL